MSTRTIIGQGKIRTIKEALEWWQPNHDEAMKVRDAEQIITEVATLGLFIQKWHEDAFKDLFDESKASGQETGRALQQLVRMVLDAMPILAGRIEWCAQHGYIVDNKNKFESTHALLEQVQQDLAKRWPFLEEADMDEGIRGIDRGECVTAEEAWRDLHSSHCK